MARSRDPFGKAVAVLKARLLTGAYGHGRPLLVSEVAAELGLSTTPVREAMARLVGEGMIEEHRGRGYMTWRMDSADLRELYELEGFYLGWAAHLCVALPTQVAEPVIERARLDLLGQGGPGDAVPAPLKPPRECAPCRGSQSRRYRTGQPSPRRPRSARRVVCDRT